jgi:hypothetical protein
VRLDENDDFISSVALGPRVVEEFVDPEHHGTTLRRADDSYPSSAREIEQTFLTKYVQGSNDGVLIHTEDGGEVHRWRQALTLNDLSVGDGSTNLCGHLFVQ